MESGVLSGELHSENFLTILAPRNSPSHDVSGPACSEVLRALEKYPVIFDLQAFDASLKRKIILSFAGIFLKCSNIPNRRIDGKTFLRFSMG